MQTLYEWEFRQNGPEAEPLESIRARNLGEFEKDADATYVQKVVQGVAAHLEEINALITEAAPEWPLDQISRIDRNVLRVAIYEMLFDPEEDVPPRVSINEAIEIGKTFGSDSSAKFVNGALGFVYRKFEDRLKPRDAR